MKTAMTLSDETLRNLVKHLPLDWGEQRRMFGLAAEKAGLAC